MTATRLAPSPTGEEPLTVRLRRAAGAGSVVISLGFVTITTLAGEVIPPVVIMAVLFAVLAGLLWRVAARWSLYLGIVLPLLALVGNAPFVVEDLAHPETAAGFVPMAVVVVAAIFTGASSLLARLGSVASVRPVAGVALGVGTLAVLGSVIATVSLSDDERQDGDVGVLASDVEYPAELRVERGAVGFFIDNEDAIRHTFLVEGTTVDQEIPGATARRVTAELEPGTYRYYCDVPGHEDMEGTLVVEG